MPNYRKNNKNNKNKNRNKNNNNHNSNNNNSNNNNNNNQNKNKNQPKNPEAIKHAETAAIDEELQQSGSQPNSTSSQLKHATECDVLSDFKKSFDSTSTIITSTNLTTPSTSTAIEVALVALSSAPPSTAVNNSTLSNEEIALPIVVAGTVSRDTATESDSRSPSDCSTSSSASTIVEDIRSSCLSPKMGTVNTKDLSDDLTCAVQNTLGATTSIVQEPQGKVIIHKIVREEYRVESPTTTEVPANASSVGAGVTRSRKKKCKSLDADDEDEGLVIQEMSDTSSVGDTDNPPLVSEAESETDIAAVEEFAVSCNNAQVISIQTLPIEASAAELFDGTSSQTSPTSPTSPNSFFSSSSQDDYKLRRVQKRAALETHFLPQFINPRYLDSIKEENSDISDTKSDTSDLAHLTISGYFDEQLEDDVFIDNEAVVKKADAVFPKSHLDFSKKRKHGPANAKGQTLPAAIREETIPCVVEAKIIEQESIEESCSTWSRGLTPESEDAEIVYINSTSSSVSDLMDLDYSEQALAPADQRNICEDLGLNSPPTAAQKCSSPHERTADDDNYDDTTAVAKQLIAGDVVPATDAILSQTTSCCTTKITNEQIGEEFAFEKTAETASISTLENTRDKATGIATVTPASLTASITSAALTSDSGNSCTSRTGDDRSKAEAADREQSVKTQMDNSRDILAFSIESAMTVVPSMSAIDLKVFSSPLLPPRSTPPAPTTSVKGAIDNQSLSPFSVDSSIALPDFRIGDPISPHNFTSATITTNHSNQNIDVDTTTNNSTNIINTSLSPPSPVILSTFLDRQESADSHCSDHSQSTTHSQCTAINKDSLTYCDWTDFDVDSSVSGGAATGDSSTLESSEAGSAVDSGESSAAIKKLRFLCTEKLASMPYGETVLEELANVATNIGEIGAAHKLHTTAATVAQQSSRDMPYPLPEIPHINDIQVSLGAEHLATLKHRPQSLTLTQVVQTNPKASPPQPVPEPPAKYDSWLGVPTASDPKLLVCLSPSQRSFMEVDQKGATTANADSLLDAHKKFIERRGYHEFTNAQVNAMNREASAERQIIQTAAMMKKLRKSLTPPPLPPPPPREALLTHSQQNDASHVVMETLNDQQQQQQQQQQNNHRLLAIIRDDSTDSSGLKPQQPTSSAYENISRPSIEIKNSEQQQQQMPTPQSQLQTDNNQVNSHKSVKFEKVENFANSGVSKQTERNVKVLDSSLFSSLVQTQQNKKSQQHYSGSTQSDPQDNICQLAAKTMESANSDFVGKCFPSKGVSNDNTFDLSQKRFSNLESASPFCSQILNTQPKRYSNIETSTYESRKCIENGHVVYDVTDSSRQTITDGDKGPQVFDVPVKDLSGKVHQQQPQSDTVKNCTTNGKTIMSEYKLNTKTLGAAAPATSKTTPTVATVNESTLHNKTSNSSTSTTTTTTSTEKQSKVSSEIFINRKPSESAADSDGHNAKAPEVGSSNGSECKSAFHFDHEKLFKDFDDLSLQLNMELETGSKAKQQWEKSSSNYDLSRWSTESKAKFEELKRSRHEHMQELEQEIERSRQSRQIKIPVQVEDLCGNSLVKERKLKTFQIPIRLEDTAMPAAPASAPIISTTRTYEIPIKVEPGYKVVSPQEEDSRFRRAESMFNLSERGSARSHNYSQSNAVADDWTRYAGDLGNSENISRPFQREVEICYSGRRPNIRAPRISVSTNDLSSPSYDAHGAYDVRRTTQIQTDSAPRNRQSQYLSCHSMIEQNPNATYISTTSRRSPVPPPVPQQPVEHNRQRRASLPRELHEKQLKYITNKEQELQAEFRRLEDERRRLIENIDLPVPPTVQRTSRDTYHSTQKLPTLSEDEVFRQQMAEEWLSKVAEREERRLQKIIKISKINQESSSTGGTKSTNVRCPKTDIGDEFLKRVKERRTKLAMPSDSDWESGAESQPVGRNDENRSEAEECPPVKVIEGQSETDIRQLPKHLREFAKITTTKQATDNQQHEMQHEEECHHHVETSANSASRTINKSSIVKNFKVTKTGPGHPDPVNASKVEGRYPYKSNGYVSEPEPNYDSDYSTVKYRTVDRRHLQSTTSATNTSVRGGRETQDDAIYGTMPNPIKSGQDSYRNQPGRIEDYVTGHSSISEKEKKEQLDQAKLSPHYTEGNLSRALLKDQGYTSDSNVVYRKKDAPQRNPLSPVEQKQVYRSVQAGGEPPLFGFRKPAPDKPKESPNRYFESDVNIHYKTPIRYEYKDPIPEEELAMRQAESMQKLYQEERRRKYLQELQDMNSRRHTDNFTPTQKSPIPLNRYDDFPTDFAPKSPSVATYPKTIARALYNFQGQTARELTFKKGDVIYIRRQVDKNWYEGEHNAMIGLLPSNYVELITKDGVRQTARKPSEGQARAKFNFQAQSGIELSLNKGELVTLTRRVDDNWFEGKIANRKGIFPISYVEVLTDIGADNYATTKSIIKTSHSTFSNVRPSLETLRTNINNELNSLTQNGHHPPNGILRETKSAHKTEALHVDTNTEPVAYRALYKYRPQNSDELELHEGDIVLVLEKCDDGWFVGTSQRSGCFGTFPGNYVERL